ncbi:MAG: adenylate/guanylate cyclase domain-containing protein [Alphaproteobacteria bacterium]|nr:adenylate/guanylate cyclase domain-containing protein [Alphaproteobacteria bacterium]
MSNRDRRGWRLVVWLSLGSIVISAAFGYHTGESTPWRSAQTGIVSSILIATPILLFEIKGQNSELMRRLRRLPLLAYLGFRVLFYSVIVVGGLMVARALASSRQLAVDEVFVESLYFVGALVVVSNVVFQIGLQLGFRTLGNLLTGRYVRPRRETRTFVLIDMKDSTGLAERLGPLRFHELLNLFFRDVADAALECRAEIHKYVGDEAILTWTGEGREALGEALSCPFVARDVIASNSQQYLARFGIVPQFRAALHRGEIVAGEIGDVRREITYVGDTLNVAARLLEAAKQIGHDVLASTALLENATLPPDMVAEALPALAVRGREAPLGIAALRRRP